MDHFTEVDFERWPRADLYRQYTERWTTCSFTFNAETDVTETVHFMKNRGRKIAPALIWMASAALNEQENFRMQVKDGVPGFWDVIHPMYPVLNPSKNITFHTVFWKRDFPSFYGEYRKEQEKNAACEKAMAEEMPPNVFSISILPNLSFTGCSFDLKNPKDYLAPVVFLGKFREEKGKLIMPASVTCNHAAADGYHVSLFFERLQELAKDPVFWAEDESV